MEDVPSYKLCATSTFLSLLSLSNFVSSSHLFLCRLISARKSLILFSNFWVIVLHSSFHLKCESILLLVLCSVFLEIVFHKHAVSRGTSVRQKKLTICQTKGIPLAFKLLGTFTIGFHSANQNNWSKGNKDVNG